MKRELKKQVIVIAIVSLVLLWTLPTLAQADEELTLSFSRDFGYASGTGDIQGTFSMKVNGPENLVKVTFFIDGISIYEDTEAPFRVQFNTDNYPLGIHYLNAVGVTTDGHELKSKVYQRNFVSAEQGWKSALTIVAPILLLTLGITLVSVIGPLLMGRKKRTIPLGAPRQYGIAGGAVCPKCKRPFALPFLAPNLLVGKLTRCPHCGKVVIATRASASQLRAAEEAELALDESATPQVTGMTEEEKLRKSLEDSRYQDV